MRWLSSLGSLPCAGCGLTCSESRAGSKMTCSDWQTGSVTYGECLAGSGMTCSGWQTGSLTFGCKHRASDWVWLRVCVALLIVKAGVAIS